MRTIDTVFALSCILTPFALGAVVGGIASGRVPVGNAAGNLWTSWTGPTSIMIGALAVATSAYLAAVYLSADAVRIDDAEMEAAFRRRALIAGVVAGALAVGGLAVLHSDAHRLYQRLLAGPGLPALIVSVAAGVAALGLVWGRRFELARYTAALAVAAIIAGWALAQEPVLLPGLTIMQAAAPHDTLVIVIVAVLAGAAILFPSLALLFSLLLLGRFQAQAVQEPVRTTKSLIAVSAQGLMARTAGACLLAGIGLLTIAGAPWAHALGVVSLFAFVVTGFAAVAPAELAASSRGPEEP